MPMITRIYVDQSVIRDNKERGEAKPPFTVRTLTEHRQASQVDFVVDGRVVASLFYRPDDPLPEGATAWIETTAEVRLA